MNTIYQQHDAAFSQVNAYVIFDTLKGEKVGKIAFKFPKDGAGRVTCYLHFHGFEMVKGIASGYGYDKISESLAKACYQMLEQSTSEFMTDNLLSLFTDVRWLGGVGFNACDTAFSAHKLLLLKAV